MDSLVLLAAAKGIGATFGALGFLSLCAWVAERWGAAAGGLPAVGAGPAARPAFTPAVAAPAPPPEPDADPMAAAAIAVGLHLRGVMGAPQEAVAAVIAAALALEARGRGGPEPGCRDSSWKMAGRLDGLRPWPTARSRG